MTSLVLAVGCGDGLRPAAPGGGDGPGGMPGEGSGSGNGSGPGSGSDGGTTTGDPDPFPSDPTGGEFAWVVSTPGAGWQAAVAVDGAGNILVAATQTGEVTLGSVHVAKPPTPTALLVLKLTADGTPIWGRSFSGAGTPTGTGTSSVSARAIATTSAGDVVVAGVFAGDLQVGARALVNAGPDDGFVLALDGDDGAPRWVAPLGSPSVDRVSGLAIGPDASGVDAIYAYGQLGAAATIDGQDFPAGTFLIRFDRDGTRRWAAPYPLEFAFPHALALDPQRGPMISGGQSLHDAAVAGFDPDGQIRFVRSMFSREQSPVTSVAVAPGGDVYLAGRSPGAPTVFDDQRILVVADPERGSTPPNQLFALRLIPDGALSQARSIGGDTFAEPYNLVVDAAGASYLLATCAGQVDVQPEVQCGTSGGNVLVSYDADNRYRWATHVGPASVDIALAPHDRLVMVGAALGAEVDFGGVRVATQQLFIAALATGAARPPSPLPVAPAIARVSLEGALDREIRQGGTGTLVIEGHGLDHVTAAQLGDLDVHVPAGAGTATELRLPVHIPHGHAPGLLDLTLSNAAGAAQSSVAVAVTPIVIGPTGKPGARGTRNSPLPLCSLAVAAHGDEVDLLDGIHTCNQARFLEGGVVVRGTSEAGTIVRGTGLGLDPELSQDPFGSVLITGLTVEDASISGSFGSLLVSDVAVHDVSGAPGAGEAISVAGGRLLAARIEVIGFQAGIGVSNNGQALVTDYRYPQGRGSAIALHSGTVRASNVSAAGTGIGIFMESGVLSLSGSDISGFEAVQAGDQDTSSGTRTVTIENTKLRGTQRVIVAGGAQLTVTDSTLGPDESNTLSDGIRIDSGTLTLTRSTVTGAQAFGIVAEPGFHLPGDLATTSVVLDDVQIDGGDTGLSYGSTDPGQLRLRSCRITGGRHGLDLVLGDAIDLGTADSPGGNQLENTSGGPALEDLSSGGVIDAHGTTFNGMSFEGEVQGPASVPGAYTLLGATTIRF